MQIFTPLIVKIEILRSLSHQRPMAPGCGMTSGNEHEGCKQHGDLIDLVQLLDHVPFAEALQRILHNTVREYGGPEQPPPRPPTDKERIAHAKKLYYAAQANMTPEREEEPGRISINWRPPTSIFGAAWKVMRLWRRRVSHT